MRRVGEGALLAAVLAAAVVVATRTLGNAANTDEGVYLASLRELRHGERLGTDIFVSQPPGFYWLLRVLAAVFVPSLHDLRVGFLLVVVAAVVGAWWLGRTVGGPPGGGALLAAAPLAKRSPCRRSCRRRSSPRGAGRRLRRPLPRGRPRAAAAERLAPRGRVVVSGVQIVPYRAGRRTDPHLVDTSFVRSRADLTVADVLARIRRSHAAAVVLGRSFLARPGLEAQIARLYPRRRRGGFTIYLPA